MNNVLNPQHNKNNAINSNMLHTTLQRDIEYALGNKPSLDGLAKIDLTPVEKPFLDMENLDLSRLNHRNHRNHNLKIKNGVKNQVNSNILGNSLEINPAQQILNQQVSNLKNEVLNTGNVAQVVEMKYQNYNGVENGLVKNTQINSLPNHKLELKQEVNKIPGTMKETVIKTYTLDLDDEENGGSWVLSNTTNTNTNSEDNELYGVKTVDPVPEVLARRKNILSQGENNEFKKSYFDMMKNMNSNKILMLVFLVLVIIIVYVIKK
jgi:hypothetical protein